MAGQGWFSCPRAKTHSMSHAHMRSSLVPKRGWPHSACLVGAVPGLCCPLNRAQPLSGNMLAGGSQSCARELSHNGTARARARQCQHCSGPLPLLMQMQLYSHRCALSLTQSLNHVFRFPISWVIRANIAVLFICRNGFNGEVKQHYSKMECK